MEKKYDRAKNISRQIQLDNVEGAICTNKIFEENNVTKYLCYFHKGAVVWGDCPGRIALEPVFLQTILFSSVFKTSWLVWQFINSYHTTDSQKCLHIFAIGLKFSTILLSMQIIFSMVRAVTFRNSYLFGGGVVQNKYIFRRTTFWRQVFLHSNNFFSRATFGKN